MGGRVEWFGVVHAYLSFDLEFELPFFFGEFLWSFFALLHFELVFFPIL